MTAPLSVRTMEGDAVRLRPLQIADAEAIAAATAGDRSSYGWTSVPDGTDGARRYVEGLLAERDAGRTAPFAQISVLTGELVGCTRFLQPVHWRGRSEPDEVEVGGTWLVPSAQRTAINTESKLLMLAYAFETWAVWRVAICTDARNARSRAAIERIGASFEGVLRNHRLAQGDAGRQPRPSPRDTAYYSITADEWPAVRAGLLARLRA